jgi:hypothetical protein
MHCTVPNVIKTRPRPANATADFMGIKNGLTDSQGTVFSWFPRYFSYFSKLTRNCVSKIAFDIGQQEGKRPNGSNQNSNQKPRNFPDMTNVKAQLSAEEAALYDRQIRLWGLDGQTRLRQAHVAIVFDAQTLLVDEIVKHVMLSGLGNLSLLSPAEPVVAFDLNPRVSVQWVEWAEGVDAFPETLTALVLLGSNHQRLVRTSLQVFDLFAQDCSGCLVSRKRRKIYGRRRVWIGRRLDVL